MLYTGMKPEPDYPPFYGAADPYREGPGSPAEGRAGVHYPRGDQGWVATAPMFDGLSRPVAGLGQVEGSLFPFVYTAASLLGAAVGGGLVGYVASESQQGTVRGAVFASGLAGVSDAMLFFATKQATAGVLVGAAGLGAIGWSLWQIRR